MLPLSPQDLYAQLAQPVATLQAVVAVPADGTPAVPVDERLAQLRQALRGDQTRRPTDPEAIPTNLTDGFHWIFDVLYQGQQQLLATVQQQAAAISQLTDALSGKASASTVQGLSQRLTTLSASVDTKASAAELASGLALKVARAGDTVAGPLVVQAPTDMSQAAQLAQLSGGVARPFRLFYNVGAAPVVADAASTGSAEIKNPFPVALVYAVRAVVIKTITAPTGAATIALTDGSGKTVFSKVVALTNLPAAGNIIDLIGGLNGPLPADIALPVTLSASASAGKFEILVDGILKKATA